MTILVKTEHTQPAYPSPMYVTPVDPKTMKRSGPTVLVKPGESHQGHIYSSCAFLVTEEHPGEF